MKVEEIGNGVRLTHVPSVIVVSASGEWSRYNNYLVAQQELRAALTAQMMWQKRPLPLRYRF